MSAVRLRAAGEALLRTGTDPLSVRAGERARVGVGLVGQ